jgi:hypothetical protein
MQNDTGGVDDGLGPGDQLLGEPFADCTTKRVFFGQRGIVLSEDTAALGFQNLLNRRYDQGPGEALELPHDCVIKKLMDCGQPGEKRLF